MAKRYAPMVLATAIALAHAASALAAGGAYMGGGGGGGPSGGSPGGGAGGGFSGGSPGGGGRSMGAPSGTSAALVESAIAASTPERIDTCNWRMLLEVMRSLVAVSSWREKVLPGLISTSFSISAFGTTVSPLTLTAATL